MSSSEYHRDYYVNKVKPKRHAARTSPARAQLRGATKELRVRLPAALHAEIAASAEAANRSLNAEVVSRLEANGGAFSTRCSTEPGNLVPELEQIERG